MLFLLSITWGILIDYTGDSERFKMHIEPFQTDQELKHSNELKHADQDLLLFEPLFDCLRLAFIANRPVGFMDQNSNVNGRTRLSL